MNHGKQLVNVFLDIETVPGETFYNDVVAEAVGPPATYTKPETIQNWWDTKGNNAILASQHAIGLMPAYNKIITLVYAINDDKPRVYSGTELGILKCFFQDLGNDLIAENGTARVVGHNIIGFDLPTIWHACIRNDVPYYYLPHPRQIKQWETFKAVDTLYQLAGRDTKGMSLGNMASLYKLEDECPDVEGSDIWSLYKAGQIDLIEDYCENDVKLTRQLFNKIKEYL